MPSRIWIVGAVLALGACSSRTIDGLPYPGGPNPDVVVVEENRERDGRENPRALRGVPKGHYPPPGECRIWYPGRPPGHQPPPARCGSLVGRVPVGAFLLYNDKAYDTEYDWRRQESRRPGTVPGVVLRIMSSLSRG